MFYVPIWFMEYDRHEPHASADASAAFEADLDTYAGTTPARRDGWTPFARRLFLEVLAETGRVSRACEYAQLTKQSAYALRARDPMFAAGWDAACELARTPLADALYERALDGTTDTITKDGEVVAERHRFDNRLSIAVLHRLDKRCDRAEDLGSRHLTLVRHWDDWLRLVGKGEEQAAQAILENARHGQLGQLPESANPTGLETEEEVLDLSDRCWRDEESLGEPVWMTDFPPPPGFAGYEIGKPCDTRYHRECTPEEAAILDASEAAAVAEARAEEEQLRDAWFDMLRAECSEADANASPEHERKLADFLEPDLVAELPGGGGASDGADFLDGQ